MTLNPGLSAGFSSTVRQDQHVRTIPVLGAVQILPMIQSLKPYGPYGTSNVGTWTNPPTLDDGYAVYDGINDAVEYSYGTGSITEFTFVFGAKWPTYTVDGITMGLMYLDNDSGLLMQRTSGHYYLFAVGAAYPGQVDMQDEVEHSICVVQTTTSRSFYVDGVLKDTSNNSPSHGFGKKICIGASRLGSTKSAGTYRNLVVFSTALNDSDRNLMESWVLT